MTALGVLPFLALLLAGICFAPGLGPGSLRRGWLRVAVAWAVFSILSLELLSVFGAVRQASLLLLWVPVTAALAYSLIRRPPRDLGHKFSFGLKQATTGQWVVMAGTAVVLTLTALVAWLAPPNTWDSLNYHMPRVAHWAQLGAVRHFPTGIEIQNSMAPGAEMLILHTYVLGQSDRWANFVQWFAVVGGLVGVSLIARQLGVGRTGQWAAVAFAASLPTGIIQASSTMTDATAGFFVLVAASEVLDIDEDKHRASRALMFALLAAGLAFHVKPTAAVFLAPFAVLAGYRILRRSIPGLDWAGLAGALTIALLVVGPHLLRNASTYGVAVGNPGHLAQHRLSFLGGRGPASVLTRNLAMHAGTPSAHVNKGIARGVQLVHHGLNLEVNDPRTTAAGQFKVRFSDLNEDKATNPIHMWLLFLLIPLGVWRIRGRRGLLLYAGAVAAGFVLFSTAFQWNEFGGRLQHPFFVLAAPAVAAVSERLLAGRWLAIGAAALLLAAVPWLLQIKSRPLLPDPGESYVGSLLVVPRSELYFANGRYLEEPYRNLVAAVSATSCETVGIQLSGAQAEYPLWVLLGAPREPVGLHWQVAGTPSAGLSARPADVCAVICEGCQQVTYDGLPLLERVPPFVAFGGEAAH